MKLFLLLPTIISSAVFISLFASQSAADDLSLSQYASQYKLYGIDSRYARDVKTCLANFPTHPFKFDKKLKFRVISPNVKVFGLGANISDFSKTNYPQLVFIRPSVNVMSKVVYELLNPNGWYCFKSKVNVMGSSLIKLACDSHLTSTTNVTVLGKSRGEQRGTTVMGKSTVKRICDPKQKTPVTSI